RRAAFLIPSSPSTEQIQMLFDLAMIQGQQLPSSPILWPEACGYSAGGVPPVGRLQDRSILLLGSLTQWRDVLPSSKRLPIQMPAGQTNIVLLQGRKNQIASFEPSLLLMQFLPSPWSSGEALVAVGGWTDFTAPALKKML